MRWTKGASKLKYHESRVAPRVSTIGNPAFALVLGALLDFPLRSLQSSALV